MTAQLIIDIHQPRGHPWRTTAEHSHDLRQPAEENHTMRRCCARCRRSRLPTWRFTPAPSYAGIPLYNFDLQSASGFPAEVSCMVGRDPRR